MGRRDRRRKVEAKGERWNMEEGEMERRVAYRSSASCLRFSSLSCSMAFSFTALSSSNLLAASSAFCTHTHKHTHKTTSCVSLWLRCPHNHHTLILCSCFNLSCASRLPVATPVAVATLVGGGGRVGGVSHRLSPLVISGHCSSLTAGSGQKISYPTHSYGNGIMREQYMTL